MYLHSTTKNTMGTTLIDRTEAEEESTIAKYIRRFRETDPAPLEERERVFKEAEGDFWWISPEERLRRAQEKEKERKKKDPSQPQPQPAAIVKEKEKEKGKETQDKEKETPQLHSPTWEHTTADPDPDSTDVRASLVLEHAGELLGAGDDDGVTEEKALNLDLDNAVDFFESENPGVLSLSPGGVDAAKDPLDIIREKIRGYCDAAAAPDEGIRKEREAMVDMESILPRGSGSSAQIAKPFSLDEEIEKFKERLAKYSLAALDPVSLVPRPDLSLSLLAVGSVQEPAVKPQLATGEEDDAAAIDRRGQEEDAPSASVGEEHSSRGGGGGVAIAAARPKSEDGKDLQDEIEGGAGDYMEEGELIFDPFSPTSIDTKIQFDGVKKSPVRARAPVRAPVRIRDMARSPPPKVSEGIESIRHHEIEIFENFENFENSPPPPPPPQAQSQAQAPEDNVKSGSLSEEDAASPEMKAADSSPPHKESESESTSKEDYEALLECHEYDADPIVAAIRSRIKAIEKKLSRIRVTSTSHD